MTDEQILEWFIRWGERWVSFGVAQPVCNFIFIDAAREGLIEYDYELRLTDKALRRIQNEK